MELWTWRNKWRLCASIFSINKLLGTKSLPLKKCDLKWIELKSHNKKRFWACRVLEVKFWTMWRGAYPCTPHFAKAEARACKVRDLPNLHIKTLAL